MNTLYSLIPKLVAAMEFPCGADMRFSLWTQESNEILKQATNYWPDNVTPGGAERLRVPQGLVGRAFASASVEIFVVSQDIEPEQHKADLIKTARIHSRACVTCESQTKISHRHSGHARLCTMRCTLLRLIGHELARTKTLHPGVDQPRNPNSISTRASDGRQP